MARLWSSGFELQSLTAGVEITLAATTAGVINTTIVRSGSASARYNGAGVRGNVYVFKAANTAGDFYARVYLYIASAPSSATPCIMMRQADATDAGSIKVNTDLSLALFNDAGVQIGSNSSTLSLNTWYRIELRVNSTTTASTVYDGRVDGTSFASGTAAGRAYSQVAWGNLQNSVTADFYFDDIAINDSTGSFQNSYPGAGSIVHLKPNASGDSNGFLAQVGGTVGSANNYTRVNEVPPDDATSYNGSAVLNAEDLFNVDDSGIGASDTVNIVAVGVRMADLAGADATAAFKVELEKTSGGTKSQSGTLIPNSTNWLTNAAAAPRNYPLTTYQDPDASNWTQSTVDSMQIGYIQTTTNVQTIAISNVWALVDYTPAGATTTSTSSTSSSTSLSTSSTSISISTSSTSVSTSISTSSTSSSISISTSSTSSSVSTSSTSSSTSKSTSTSSTSQSTSISTSVSTTSISTSFSTSSTSSSTSRSTSTSSTSTSQSTSTSSTSTSISTSSTSTSFSTSSTSQSTSTSLSTSTTQSFTTSSSSISTSSTSISQSTSTSSTSISLSTSTSFSTSSTSTSRSTSTSSTSTSRSTSTSSTSVSNSTSISSSISTSLTTTTSTSSTSVSTSSTSASTSSTTTLIAYDIYPIPALKPIAQTNLPINNDSTIMDDPVVIMDDPTALMGGLTADQTIMRQSIVNMIPKSKITIRR